MLSKTLKLSNHNYPELLKTIPNPPKYLYYRGTLGRGAFDKCLAVIGSRNISRYGENVIEYLFRKLSKDITVVSGFMRGVDMHAHSQAVKNGLKTIAVVPHGIDYKYDGDALNLYSKIISSGGLVISELNGTTGSEIWMYPRRNRIVAGICKALVVIEASENSGTVMTADISNSFGRKVFVVPGSIFSGLSKGKILISNKYATNIDSSDPVNDFMGKMSIFG